MHERLVAEHEKTVKWYIAILPHSLHRKPKNNSLPYVAIGPTVPLLNALDYTNAVINNYAEQRTFPHRGQQTGAIHRWTK